MDDFSLLARVHHIGTFRLLGLYIGLMQISLF